MTARGRSNRLMYWAGVALGPAAWGVNVQAVYTMAPHSCSHGRLGSYVLTAVLVLVALAGTAISARAISRGTGAEWSDHEGGIPRNFMAWMGAGSGVLFALVIANQLAASTMISPCLH